jgi:dTDP-4-amino-4,6-dideoxygalactose transaminase
VGYPIPLYKNPLFAAPEKRDYDWPFYSSKMDYSGVVCPNAEQICEEACWIPQTTLLGESSDMQDIANAIEKVWEQKDVLATMGE